MSAVLNAPPVRKLTPDDLYGLPDGGKGFELVDGEPREKEMSVLSSYVAGRVFQVERIRGNFKDRLGFPQRNVVSLFPRA